MPVTFWSEVPRGQKCEITECTNYATHYFGDVWICCDCHACGEGFGLIAAEDAKAVHETAPFGHLAGEGA